MMDSTVFVRAVLTDKDIRKLRARVDPEEVWYFVACFVFVVALFQRGSWAISKLSRRRASSTESERQDAEAGAPSIQRGYAIRRLPAALANAYRVAAFRWTLQIGNSYTLNMAEVFVTIAYIIAVFVWEFTQTTDLEGMKLDMDYWGNRAGTIAACQLPLVTALGTKNNVLSYVTGITYDKLNYVHRMTARVMFVLLWVHGGAKFNSLDRGEINGWFVRIGITAMIAFSVLVAVSLRPIRARAYELFFVTHFLMVLIILIGGYFHTRYEGMGYYIWPCFIVWALDRFIRVVRVVVFNHLYFSWSSRKGSLDGTVELLSPHFVRLRLWRPPHFSWNAGQTAFLTLPGVSTLPWEAHPFTISSIDGARKDTLDDEKSGADEDAPPGWKELVFLINVRDGFTKRLAKAADKGKKVAVLVDGPYGLSPSLSGDDTAVLVAGGSGVSYTLAMLLNAIQAARNGTSACRKVVFVWVMRDSAHIEWIAKSLASALEVAPAHLAISIRLFVTAGQQKSFEDDSIASHSDAAGKAEDGKAEVDTSIKEVGVPSLLGLPTVEVTHSRPDLVSLLRDEVSTNKGHMSVTVCGSQAIARTCRSALSFPVSGPTNILKGGPSVVLHIESFGYA